MINFEKLNVYQEALILALKVYKLTKQFPKEEQFGLTSQIRRAVVSISLNIAEGSSRSSKEFSHFLDIARGSGFELVPLLKISLELGFITQKDHDSLYEEVQLLLRKINALKKSINH